jgi:hypothetical protein
MSMRMSIIAGLTLCAAMGAGQAHALTKKPVVTVQRNPIAKPTEIPTQFRIPAQPLVLDCVHVTFPQCTEGGLNDGSFRW